MRVSVYCITMTSQTSSPASDSSTSTPKIELWMDNWAWAVADIGAEREPGEFENPDDSGRTPPGLYKLGKMAADLRMECEQLKTAVTDLKVRMSMLEGQLKTMQPPKSEAPRTERRNGW
jgi:hypothetical protein